ncbi:hypothetical protein BC629DRAFT_149955 [Irpex lacteus]|nr:hypothetical protein BC629DRAFT_149955 [Irpex lacteus]
MCLSRWIFSFSAVGRCCNICASLSGFGFCGGQSVCCDRGYISIVIVFLRNVLERGWTTTQTITSARVQMEENIHRCRRPCIGWDIEFEAKVNGINTYLTV